MNIRKASQEECCKVYNIVEEIISKVYPKYYPAAVVNSFLEHHSKDKIIEAFNKEIILVVIEDNDIVATGAIEKKYNKEDLCFTPVSR